MAEPWPILEAPWRMASLGQRHRAIGTAHRAARLLHLRQPAASRQPADPKPLVQHLSEYVGAETRRYAAHGKAIQPQYPALHGAAGQRRGDARLSPDRAAEVH